MDTATTNVISNSVCLILQFSRLRTKRAVGSDEIDVDADKSLIHVAKSILDSEELRNVSHYDHETRRWIKRRSTPFELLGGGIYLLPVDFLQDVYAYLENRETGRAGLISKFEDVYPEKIKEAKKRLGKLFDATEYPSARAVKDAFQMTFRIVEWGTPEKKLRAISKAMYEKEAKKAEQEWTNATEQIRDALRASMGDLVTHLVERLGGAEDGKPKRFRESTLKNVQEFLDLFEKRNLTQDGELAKLVVKAKKIVEGVDAESLRDDEKLRGQVVKQFAEIKTVMDGMLETKPARRMSLADEEV